MRGDEHLVGGVVSGRSLCFRQRPCTRKGTGGGRRSAPALQADARLRTPRSCARFSCRRRTEIAEVVRLRWQLLPVAGWFVWSSTAPPCCRRWCRCSTGRSSPRRSRGLRASRSARLGILGQFGWDVLFTRATDVYQIDKVATFNLDPDNLIIIGPDLYMIGVPHPIWPGSRPGVFETVGSTSSRPHPWVRDVIVCSRRRTGWVGAGPIGSRSHLSRVGDVSAAVNKPKPTCFQQ
jgi:hypothetical protein